MRTSNNENLLHQGLTARRGHTNGASAASLVKKSEMKPSKGEPESATQVNTWCWEEIKLGRLLGSGGFASVYSVEYVNNKEASTKHYGESTSTEDETDSSVANMDEKVAKSTASQSVKAVLRGPTDYVDSELALKCVKRNPRLSGESLEIAARDFIQETSILKEISMHSNIVSLVAVSDNLHLDPENGFIILERVYDTLDRLLQRWKLKSVGCQTLGVRVETGSLRRLRTRLLDQILPSRRKKLHESQRSQQAWRINKAAIGLAEALAFLHSHNILYRDLKPANVGFDSEGGVRLLDFGCSRFIDPQDPNQKLTQCVGTLRYMAPEVTHQYPGHYGFASDAYSFALLLWEILSLSKPPHCGKMRPPLRPIASPEIRSLLQASWHQNPVMRPSFSLIIHELLRESEQFVDWF